MDPVGLVLVIVFSIIGVIWWMFSSVHNNHLLATGQAKMLVKIAASGQGKTFHSPHCNRCRSGRYITLDEALAQHYARCSSCGGNPGLVKIRTD